MKGINYNDYASLTKSERLILCHKIIEKRWLKQARDEQKPGVGMEDTWVTHLIMAGRGFGKDLAIETPILTANRGWVTMETIQVGDVVFDERGVMCNVTFISDITDEKDMYELTFSDSSRLVASDTHEWVTTTHAERKKARRDGVNPKGSVRETKEIFDTQVYGSRNDTNHAIVVAGPLHYPPNKLPVNPYDIGVWLGDGASKERTIYLSNRDEQQIAAWVSSIDDEYRVQEQGCARYRLDIGVWRKMRNMGLYGNKHIPAQYMTSSIQHRKQLLAGIIDTDGHISSNSSCEITLCNKALADDVYQLVLGLGIKATMSESDAVLNGNAVGTRYRINFTIYRDYGIPIRSRFKSDRIKPAGKQSSRQSHRMIKSVVPVDRTPCRCIAVDSPSHLYLAGKNLIPTHNTRAGAEWIVGECLRIPNCKAGILAPTFDHAIKVCIEGESGIKSIVPDHSLIKFNEKKKQFVFANGSTISLYSSEHQRQLAGPQFHRFWIDEPADLSHGMNAWKKLRPAVRLKTPDGSPARILITGTPAPVPLVVHIHDLHEKDPSRYTLGAGKTSDNIDNLDPIMVEELYERYKNSRYLAQEMEGKLLLQAEGALWTRDTLFGCGIPYESGMEYDEVIISVDPAVSTDRFADETGIIVLGRKGKKAYVLADYSCKKSALEWCRGLITIAERHNASKIVYERNLAGPLIEDVLKRVLNEVNYGVKLAKVSVNKSKLHRAEPVSALYEAGRVFHVNDTPDGWSTLEKLEAQMTTWEPKDSKSPDRIDALTQGVTYLLINNSGRSSLSSASTYTSWGKK